MAKFIQCREHPGPHLQHTVELSGYREWHILPAHLCFTLTGHVILGLLPYKLEEGHQWGEKGSVLCGHRIGYALHLSCPLLGCL